MNDSYQNLQIAEYLFHPEEGQSPRESLHTVGDDANYYNLHHFSLPFQLDYMKCLSNHQGYHHESLGEMIKPTDFLGMVL